MGQSELPTRGPVEVFYNDEARHPFMVVARASNGRGLTVATLPEITQPGLETGSTGGTIVAGMGAANAELVAAAFNFAEEARKLGFDPIAAVEALPELLRALNDIAEWSENLVSCSGDEFPGCHGLARSALAAARTRGVTT